MKILAFECSASPASVAIIDNGKIIASEFMNIKTTHSQTLLPMCENVLKKSGININDIEGLAVAAGPGSFTGIRIGISVVKGLAAPKNLPCARVSTLEALAQPFTDEDCIVCPVMDARCKQLYNALFEIKNGEIIRLCFDRAILFDELLDELKTNYSKKSKIILCGDGADIFSSYLNNKISNVYKANEILKYQNAVNVALLSEKIFKDNKAVKYDELLPFYLRLPQAERELNAKKSEESNK